MELKIWPVYVMLLNVIICQIFNLPLIYHIFAKKIHFQINRMVSKHGSNCVKWHGAIYFQLS
jgi:hypothetical protein